MTAALKRRAEGLKKMPAFTEMRAMVRVGNHNELWVVCACVDTNQPTCFHTRVTKNDYQISQFDILEDHSLSHRYTEGSIPI